MSFDVASYFNNVYHHDLFELVLRACMMTQMRKGLVNFYDRSTLGRSIDCLPQGLYPTKMIGNDFLRL